MMFPAEEKEHTNRTAIDYHFLVCSRKPMPSACSSRQNCCCSCYCQPVHSSGCIHHQHYFHHHHLRHITSTTQATAAAVATAAERLRPPLDRSIKHNQSTVTDPQTRNAREEKKHASFPFTPARGPWPPARPFSSVYCVCIGHPKLSIHEEVSQAISSLSCVNTVWVCTTLWTNPHSP